jgi:hypothetical protein
MKLIPFKIPSYDSKAIANYSCHCSKELLELFQKKLDLLPRY